MAGADDRTGGGLTASHARQLSKLQSELPPTDRGAQAWRFVLGTWFMEALFWGFPLSFGIFEAYYAKHELFRNDADRLATVGLMCNGMIFFGVPFVSPFVLRYPQYQRHMMGAGWCLCLLSVVATSFATKFWQLVFFQGVCYGCGWVICYTPFLNMLNGWFIEKRGLVYGILFGSAGISGIVLPFLFQGLLNRYDFRVTLRVFAACTALISAPGMIKFVKPRVSSYSSGTRERGDWKFLRDTEFWFFILATFFQGLSFFLPIIFMPVYARSLVLSESQAATLVALFCIAQTCGQITLGGLSDKINIHITSSVSTAGAGLATLLLWGNARTFAVLCTYMLLYGFFAGAYTVLWSRQASHLTDDSASALNIFALLSFDRGLANCLTGPISESLLTERRQDFRMYGLERYKGIIIFTGVTMLVSSFNWIGFFFHRKHKGFLGRGVPKSESEADAELREALRKGDQELDEFSVASDEDEENRDSVLTRGWN